MFIGREKELKQLTKDFDQEGSTVAIIYGRRRVGKTTLIQEFIKGRKAIFFSSQEGSSYSNLQNLSNAILNKVNDAPVFQDFRSALMAVSRLAKEEKTVFVIDEFPYLTESLGREILSVLQNFIDLEMKQCQLMLILCGSSITFMEKDLLSNKNPLFGRARTIIRLKALSYYETGLWFEDYPSADKAVMYGITGGIPMYLSCMDSRLTVKENLLNTIFNTSSLLYGEPENFMRQSVKEIKSYNAVIDAIASGKTKFNEIVDITKLNPGMVLSVISTLSELDILKKVVKIGEKGNSKKGYYQISDLFFRFWYFFVPRNMTLIESGRIEEYYDVLVGNLLSDYMGKVFEQISAEYLMLKARLPFPVREIGTWWANAKDARQAEIDIVATSAINDDVIIGSCKFTGRKIGISELELMKEYASTLSHHGNEDFWFFSKSGFSESIVNSDNVHLISIDEMYMP